MEFEIYKLTSGAFFGPMTVIQNGLPSKTKFPAFEGLPEYRIRNTEHRMDCRPKLNSQHLKDFQNTE